MKKKKKKEEEDGEEGEDEGEGEDEEEGDVLACLCGLEKDFLIVLWVVQGL